MKPTNISRRTFLQLSVATGAALVAHPQASFAASTAPAKRTATDQVTLNQTGIRMSRLGIGTGSNNGHVQTDLGQAAFTDLIHYAFDQGITYIDTAQAYATFNWIAGAIKGLPREKLFLLSKIPGQPADVLANIDRHRSTFKTDYIDTLLIHCMTSPTWTDDWKRIMEGFNTAKERKWIRSKGVSCHSLDALQAANQTPWTEVHLVRVNPMGVFMDAKSNDSGRHPIPIDPVLTEIQQMHQKGRGIIGMKIMGNGTFTNPAERQKSLHFAMHNPNIDAVVVGMKSNAEIDGNIKMLNAVLAA